MNTATTALPPFVIAIPARYGASRLPGKPLHLLAGEPLIRHVVRRAQAAGAAEVVVAIDDARIAEGLAGSGAQVAMTAATHASGSDRLAECAVLLGWTDDTVVVNLQGDEPFAPVAGIRAVVAALIAAGTPMATLATPIAEIAQLFDPNIVKVVCDRRGRALYFSRAPLPWPRDAFAADRTRMPDGVPFLRHIGVYAYRAGFLRTFPTLPRMPLEQTESLEQLRVLEHGHAIAVALSPEGFPPGIDTPEDLARAERALAGGAAGNPGSG